MMTEETVFSAPPPVPEEVVSRLRKSAQKPRVPIGGIWDCLTKPETACDLELLLTASDCRMYHGLEGVPRAFMEVPVSNQQGGGSWPFGTPAPYAIERWLYMVYGWYMVGTRKRCESILCRKAWDDMVVIRKEYEERFEDGLPLLVWRRRPEVITGRRPTPQGTKLVTSLSMRLFIPGIDLHARPGFQDGTHEMREYVAEEVDCGKI